MMHGEIFLRELAYFIFFVFVCLRFAAALIFFLLKHYQAIASA